MLDKEALTNGAEEYRWLLDALEEKSGEDVVLMDLSSVGKLWQPGQNSPGFSVHFTHPANRALRRLLCGRRLYRPSLRN